MSSEIDNEEKLNALKKNTSAFDGIKTNVLSTEMQKVINDSQMVKIVNDTEPMFRIAKILQMNASIASVMQEDTVKSLASMGNRIVEMISTVNFAPILKKLSEAFIPIKYIYLLERLKWPIFLISDDRLRDEILEACSMEEDLNRVKEIIFEYCTDEFLMSIENSWNMSKVVSQERKPILLEAMLMYRKGYYYSSTTLLMCQLYGVASDIIDIAKKNGLELDEESKNYIADCFEIKREDIDKEKGKLMQMTAITESGKLLWDAMANYLMTEILCSSDSKKRWKTQPLRNKICHGDQMNFGTKEHSLKAILTIDMLIKLAHAIQRIAESRNTENEEKI